MKNAIKERLGHVSDATASNYEDYQVVDINGKPLTRGAWVERIGEKLSEPKQIMTQSSLGISRIAAKGRLQTTFAGSSLPTHPSSLTTPAPLEIDRKGILRSLPPQEYS